MVETRKESYWHKVRRRITLGPQRKDGEEGWTIQSYTPEDQASLTAMLARGADEGAFPSPLDSKLSYQIFTAKMKNQTIGYIHFFESMGVGSIQAVYVLPDFRGKGIGRSLIEKALDEFNKRGCHKAKLCVYTTNKAAIELYTYLGFIQEAYLKNDEMKRDMLILSKFFK